MSAKQRRTNTSRSLPAAERKPKQKAEGDQIYAGWPPQVTNLLETPLWAQFSRIGGGVSPATVSNIILEADSGCPTRLVDLFHECRQRDGSMQHTLSLREVSVAALDWAIELPENAKRKDKKLAAKLELALRQCDTLPLLLAHEVGEGNAFGYAFSEARWRYGSGGGDLGGVLYPFEFEPVHSRRFGYRQADGKLLFLPTPASFPDKDGVDLFAEYAAGNYVGYFPRINGDAMVREGYAVLLIWMAMFRNWDVRDWAQFGEIGWKPWRVGVYKKGADNDDKQILSQAIKFMAASGAALIPETTDYRVEWPKGAAASQQSTHAEFARFLAEEMSKTVLNGTLNGDSGTRGARSLGEVHERGQKLNRDFDACGVDSFMTRHICAPFWAYNGGTPGVHARFRCNIRETMSLDLLANAIDKLAGKVDIPQQWVRDQGGIRDPKDDEPLVVGAPAVKPDATGEQDKTAADQERGSDDGQQDD